MIDVIIVGSGASGVNAAYPLCEAGMTVLMLDYGTEDSVYRNLVPPRPFVNIRQTDEQQHLYFLGDNFEGILLGSIRVGTKLTPPRVHIVSDAPILMPVESETFSANESLALGGLASSWGAGALPFRDDDFKGMPISFTDLKPHYATVAKRIGISGARDDIQNKYDDFGALMPPLEIDSNAEKILKKYEYRKKRFNQQGFFLGRARLAVCTQPHRGRQAHHYRDMDYWADTDDSVYRPHHTLKELRNFANFSYVSRRFVLTFSEKEDGTVEVVTHNGDRGKAEVYSARALILCAGTMSTARIVLRSLNRYGVQIPILTNPYSYIPSINFGMLGITPKDRRCSLAQLSALYISRQADRKSVHAYLFSYRSLLTFKLLKEAPLPHRECLRIMRLLMPLFNIVTIFHEDYPSASKYCILHQSSGDEPDRLEIQYNLSKEEEFSINADEKEILNFFRRMNCWPLKRIRRAHGGSIHYSGTLPMTNDKRELTCDAKCRLFGTRSVYVADGSVISPMPATVLTFTLMANANRVGTNLAERLKR